MLFIRTFLVFCILLVCLAACEAGSSDGLSTPSLGESALSTESDTNSVNRGLSGYLTAIWRTQPWKVDMATGEFSRFPRVAFEDDPAFNNLAKFQLTPIGSNSSGFLLAVSSCYLDGIALLGCIQFLDRDGAAIDTYYFSYNISVSDGNAPVSKDGSLFAILSRDIGTQVVTIYRRTGEFVASEEFSLLSSLDINLDWGIDGVLYYSRQDETTARIYYWDPEDSSTSGHLEFELDGSIGKIRTSPVDRKIAFELINAESSVYMADLDTGKAWRLVKPDDSFDTQFFSSPVWSPDGEWILADHHIRDASLHGLPPHNVIAIPADAVELVYEPNNTSSSAVPFRIEDNAAEAIGAATQSEWFRGGATYWLSDQ